MASSSKLRACVQACVRTSAATAARRSRSAVRWSRTAARCTVVSSTSHTNSVERRSTCARSADTRPGARSSTSRTSSNSIRPARRCFGRTTSATSSSPPRPTGRCRCRAGTSLQRPRFRAMSLSLLARPSNSWCIAGPAVGQKGRNVGLRAGRRVGLVVLAPAVV